MPETTDWIILFCGSNFYPNGGWGDFKGYFQTIEKAKEWLLKNEPDASYMWAHIVINDKIVLYASNCAEYARQNEWVWREEE